MATLLSIADTIRVGDMSGPLSSLYVDKKAMYGGTVIKPVPPLLITIITDALRWATAETAADQRSVVNYLYWLCGRFGLEAQNIISGPGGGTVIPGAVTSLPYPLDFLVDGSSFISTGETTSTISLFVGYNIEFDRGGQPQYTTDPGDGSTYYSWNRATGAFALLNGAAQLGERFRILPSR